MAVVAALAAALCYALAAALEHQQAQADAGPAAVHPGLLWRLVRRPLWLLGFVVGAVGAGLHLLALATGPLTTVQPIGVTVVVFAVPLGALLRRHRPAPVDLLAAVTVAAGLAVLVSTLSTTTAPRPPGDHGLLVATGLAVAVAGVAACCGRRSVVLAAAATLLGLTSALVRAEVSTGHGVGAFLHPATLLLVGCVVVGTLLEQASYKTGALAATVAVMTMVDPLVSIGLGSLLLGQTVQVAYPVLTGVATPVVLAGVLTLIRRLHRPAEPVGPPGPRAVVSVSR